MINPLWFFIPGILILGIFTSYTDIKYGKIKNKAILFALIYALLANLFVIFIIKMPISNDYIFHSIGNLFSALILGFVMWYIGVWTAGDGKLFLAFAALVPLFVYNEQSFIPYFQSMNILINTFFPVFIFYFFKLLIKTSWKEKKEALKQVLNIKILIGLAVSLFVFLWFDRLVYFLIGKPMNLFLEIFLIFLIFIFLEKIFSKKIFIFLIALAVLRLVFDRTVYSLGFLKLFISIFALFLFFRMFLLNLGFFSLTMNIEVKNLKPGMMPAEMIHFERKKYTKRKIIYFSFFDYLRESRTKGEFDFQAEGLTKKGINKIKRLAKKHKNLKNIRIQQTMPFAPFLFLGAVLTLIGSGNFLAWAAFHTIIFINGQTSLIKSGGLKIWGTYLFQWILGFFH